MEKEKLNILVTGSDGQLGGCIINCIFDYNEHKDNWRFLNKSNLDITDKSAVRSFIVNNKIDVVVNCAAFTDVDRCEDPEYGRGIAYEINVNGPKYLAEVLKETKGTLIHISTDYVFDGYNNGYAYEENIRRSPVNKYGKLKRDAEIYIEQSGCNYLIIRTSWLYSRYGKNFLWTMMNKMKDGSDVKVVCNQIGTPTYAMDLAAFIVKAIEQRTYVIPERETDTIREIYHYTNEGVASWYDFACAIKEYFGFSSKIIPCYDWEFPRPADRPHFSVLDKLKVRKTFDIDIPYWRDSLKICITKLMSNE